LEVLKHVVAAPVLVFDGIQGRQRMTKMFCDVTSSAKKNGE
jgi:hypothetical protein